MVDLVIATIVVWLVEKTLDTLLERWKKSRQRAPLTDAQVIVEHRRHFRLALVPCVVTTIAIVVSLATGLDAATRTPIWYAGMAVLIALAVYGAHVARRRWRRLEEAIAAAALRARTTRR